MAQNKNFNSIPYKRIIDLARIDEAQVNDLIRVWRTANGDEKSITLEDLLVSLSVLGVRDTNAVHYDVGDGKDTTEQQQARDNINVYSTEEVDDLLDFVGEGITLNSKVIGGVKMFIELVDVLEIPLYWQYNIHGNVLKIDGVIINNGEINIG